MTEPGRTPDALIVLPVRGIGEITPGTALAEVIWAAAPWLRDGDVLIVTSKIVSKAEGRLVTVPPDEGPERDAARQAAVTAETARTVATRGPTRIVQTRHGFVLAAAGIDASNVDPTHLVLLPLDPDASARALRAALREVSGREVGVVITDTMGRPWRLGLTDVAIGAAGLPALRDHRGEVDAYGNDLFITQLAVVDELAAAGELVKGKTDQVPVAVVRGFLPRVPTGAPDGDGARVLIRDAESDMFSLGTAEARADGLRTAATLPDREPDDQAPAGVAERLAAALAIVPEVAGVRWHPLDERAAVLGVADGPAAVALGTAVHRLRVALWAGGLASAWQLVRPADFDLPAGGVGALVTVSPGGASPGPAG
ncbi:coenzyme F420-0:L-glutamate ligase [Luedemannella helvata]|uniref:Coenzyme F420:L-glutamate ligase-like domain-containing protein n=1 Tax=Luedemannella helvata TaxID=349315 RepID=A0ABN2K0W5_9ACTN